MKKNKLFLLLMTIIFCQSVCYSQSGKDIISIYGGFNCGINDYGNITIFDNEILSWGMKNKSSQGGAGIGGNIGISFNSPEVLDNLTFSMSLDCFVNGLSKSLKTYYDELEVENSYTYDKYKRKDQYFFNVPLILGANYIINTRSTKLDVFLDGGIGINIRFITDYYEYWNKYKYTNESLEYTEDYDITKSFAYRCGVGLEFMEEFTLGVYYYGTTSAAIKGDFNMLKYDISGEKIEETRRFLYGKVKTSMFVVRVGYHF